MRAFHIALIFGILVFCASADVIMQISAAERPFSGIGSSFDRSSGPSCSDGWRITGYFTPVESDYTSTEMVDIDIRGLGKMSFNAEFIKVVFNDDEGYGEGWGKTRFGWYLGEYNGRWHKADAPLDANDKPLEPDTVAVDNKLIPAGSVVSIPNLPGDLGKLEFKSNDVGVSVHGKHIDVYTGEGRDARRKMYRFTYEEDGKGLQRVCFSPAASH